MKRSIIMAALFAATLTTGAGPVLAAPPADPMQLIVRETMHEEHDADAMMLSEHPSDGRDCGPPQMPYQEWRRPGEDGRPLGMAAHECPPAFLMKLLDLSDAQKKQIAAIVQGRREKTSSLLKQRGELRRQLRQAERAEPFSEKQVRNITSNLAKLEADMIISRVGLRSQVKAVLTPAQRDMVKKLENATDNRQGSHPAFDGG
jgi:Spy/CpxP family protein refolding chaperone